MSRTHLKSHLTLAGAALVLMSTSHSLQAQNAMTNTSTVGAVNAATSGPTNSASLGADGAVTDIPPAETTSAANGDSLGSGNLLQERTTIDYRGAPLVDVLRHLASATKINIAISPTVEAGGSTPVTVWLTDVTYETVLRTIFDMYRLGSVLENGILRIDTLDNLKKDQDDKKRISDEKVRLEPTRILIWPLNYAKATDIAPLILNALRSYLTIDNRISVQADARSNKLLIEGTQNVQSRVKTLLENLDRRKQQITIEARIIEASNEVSRTLRVNWGARFGMSARNGLTSGIIFPNSILGNIGGAGEVKSYPVSNAAPEPGTLGLTLGSINGILNIDAILKAYETENLAHVIASPSLTVLDNEKASFSELITIKNMTPVAGTTGSSFDSKLSLDVVPLIAHDGSVELDVIVDRDTPTTAPSDLMQGKVARSAKTKLAVRNGDTAVIGGLYQTTKTKNAGRIPLLGKIPILGFLFRSNDEHTMRTELMILITPKVHPAVAGGMASTTDIAAPAAPASNLGINAGGLNGANATTTSMNPPAAPAAEGDLDDGSLNGTGNGLKAASGGNGGNVKAAGNNTAGLNGGGNMAGLNGGGANGSGANAAADLGDEAGLNAGGNAPAPNAAASPEPMNDELESLE